MSAPSTLQRTSRDKPASDRSSADTAIDGRRELNQLLSGPDDVAVKLRRVFRWINAETGPLVGSLYVDFGESKPLSLLHRNPAVPNLLAIQIRQRLFDKVLQEIKNDRQSKVSIESIDDNLFAVLAVPIILDSSDDEDGDPNQNQSSDQSQASENGAWAEPANEAHEDAKTKQAVAGAFVMASPVPANGMGILNDRKRWIESVIQLASTPFKTEDADVSNETGPVCEESANRLLQSIGQGCEVKVAMELVNQLAGSMPFEQVAVGLVRRKNVSLLAISGASEIKKNSPGAIQIRQAMLECLDNQSAVYSPGIDGIDTVAANAIHTRWSQTIGGVHVGSMPMTIGDGVDAILSWSCPANQSPNKKQLEQLTQQIGPVGPALKVMQKASRSPGKCVREELATKCTGALRGPIRRLMIACMIAGLYWFLACESVYRPRCLAEMRSGLTHVVASPFDGVLSEAYVKEGQQVAKGQAILKLDTRSLELEREILSSRMREAEVRLSNTLVERDPTSMAVAQAEVGVVRQEIAAINDKIDRAQVVAISDSVVAHANLDEQVGQPFSTGDELLQLISTESWKVQIKIPDSISTEISLGQTGQFTPTGRPDQSFPLTVESISGVAEVVDGRNVFLAVAVIDGTEEWMRSGMEGVARIESRSRSNYWIWCHDLWDWARLQTWY